MVDMKKKNTLPNIFFGYATASSPSRTQLEPKSLLSIQWFTSLVQFSTSKLLGMHFAVSFWGPLLERFILSLELLLLNWLRSINIYFYIFELSSIFISVMLLLPTCYFCTVENVTWDGSSALWFMVWFICCRNFVGIELLACIWFFVCLC